MTTSEKITSRRAQAWTPRGDKPEICTARKQETAATAAATSAPSMFSMRREPVHAWRVSKLRRGLNTKAVASISCTKLTMKRSYSDKLLSMGVLALQQMHEQVAVA